MQLTVDNSEILEVVSFLKGAVMPVESMRDEFPVGVDIVKDDVRIGGTAGCEDDDLCELSQLLEELLDIGPDPDSCLNSLWCTARMPPLSKGKFSFTV